MPSSARSRALWGLVLGFLFCLIAAHVAGNALGTKLRDQANKQILAASDPPADVHRGERAACAPAQRLVERTGISGAAIVVTLIGAGLGGSLGGSAVTAANWNQITLAGIAVAVFSAAVLGGILAFLASSFLLVGSRAARSPPPRPPPGKLKPSQFTADAGAFDDQSHPRLR